MAGYAFGFGPCIACGVPFAFNPAAVPSSSAVTGTREPICRGCMDRINALRRSRGVAEHPVRPDAYEPCPEEAL